MSSNAKIKIGETPLKIEPELTTKT